MITTDMKVRIQKRKSDEKEEDLMTSNQTKRKIMRKTRGEILKTYHTVEGTLYKGDVIIVEEQINDKTRITDLTGRIFWVDSKDVHIPQK